MPSSQVRRKRAQGQQARKPLKSQGRRIIGIDLATTRACVAFAVIPSDQLDPLRDQYGRPTPVEIFANWPTAYETSTTNPPTALYYEEHKRLPTTGNTLTQILKARRRPGEAAFDTERFFRLWKLMFHDNQNDDTIKEIQADIQSKLDRLHKTRGDLLREWVGSTYMQLFIEAVDGQCRLNDSDERNLDLEIVVAVPPGRSVIAHEEVLQGFIQKPILAHQVSLVSEPEAMFRSWVNDGVHTQDWKVGTRYLVADGGGGTCCFVRFRLDRLDPLGFTQEFESESVICGAETISNSFEKLASTTVPPNQPNRAYVLDNLRRQFDDMHKLHFGYDNDENALFSYEQPWDRNSMIDFSYAQIAACFDKCVKKILEGIQRQLRRGDSGSSLLPQRPSPLHDSEFPADAQHISTLYLVLGGGLFSNPYVLKVIKTTFPNLEVRELSGDKGKGHVARGAVLTRLHARNTFITSRPIMRSKAIITWKSIDSSIRNSPLYPLLVTYIDPLNGVEYFYAAQWLVKQGDEATLKHAEDIYEVVSESSFETARTRVFDVKNKEKFTETIVTVDYNPGGADWAAFRKGDNRLVDQNGSLIPGYVQSETLKWDPLEIGVSVGGLQIKRSQHGSLYKIIHYSIQMQMREVGTKYWIKAWSLNNKSRQVVFSDAIERQTVFGPHEIERSLNLSESRKLGSGIRAEDNPSEEVEPAVEAQLATIEAPVSEPHFEQPETGSCSAGLKKTPSSRKRGAPNQGPRRPRVFSRSPLQHARTLQRQSSEDSSEYPLGTPRKNGDCWTCALRNSKCDRGEPICLECSRVGVECEYGLPIWWHDEALQEAQKKINKRLIKDQNTRMRLEKQQAVKSSRQGAKTIQDSFTPVRQPFKPTNPVDPEMDVRQSKLFQPMIATSPSLKSNTAPSTMIYDERRASVAPPKSPETNYPRFVHEDLYDASPPRHTHDEFVRRSNRQRRSHIPDDMKGWKDIDKEEFGIQSESDSETTASQEDYFD